MIRQIKHNCKANEDVRQIRLTLTQIINKQRAQILPKIKPTKLFKEKTVNL